MRWWPVVILVVGIVLVVFLVYRFAAGYQQTKATRLYHSSVYLQHAARRESDRAIVVWYPSEAAKDHDPVWGRGGYYSVAARFRTLPDGTQVQIGPWFRTYAESFDTLQRKD